MQIAAIRAHGDGKAFREEIDAHRGLRAVIDRGVYEGVDFAVLEHGNDAEEPLGGNEHKISALAKPVGLERGTDVLFRGNERGVPDAERLPRCKGFSGAERDADGALHKRMACAGNPRREIVLVRQGGNQVDFPAPQLVDASGRLCFDVLKSAADVNGNGLQIIVKEASEVAVLALGNISGHVGIADAQHGRVGFGRGRARQKKPQCEQDCRKECAFSHDGHLRPNLTYYNNPILSIILNALRYFKDY